MPCPVLALAHVPFLCNAGHSLAQLWLVTVTLPYWLGFSDDEDVPDYWFWYYGIVEPLHLGKVTDISSGQMCPRF